jgi:hypothetical protein
MVCSSAEAVVGEERSLRQKSGTLPTMAAESRPHVFRQLKFIRASLRHIHESTQKVKAPGTSSHVEAW